MANDMGDDRIDTVILDLDMGYIVTLPCAAALRYQDMATGQRRKLNLKAEVESSISQYSFKRLVPGGFSLGFIGSTCTALPRDSWQSQEERFHRFRCVCSPRRRGLHSSTFRLNVNAFCGIGGTFRGSSGGVYEVSEGIREY